MYSVYKLNKQGDNIQSWYKPFPIWNQSIVPCLSLTVVSWPAYRFGKRQLRQSGIPISWRISQFAVIHTGIGFSIVKEAEIYLFFFLFVCLFVCNSLAFSMSQQMLAIWSLVLLPFLIPALYIWKVLIHILLKFGMENFEYFSCEMSANVLWLEHSLVLPFFGIGMKTYLILHSIISWRVVCTVS